jgi:hypothetical protein
MEFAATGKRSSLSLFIAFVLLSTLSRKRDVSLSRYNKISIFVNSDTKNGI